MKTSPIEEPEEVQSTEVTEPKQPGWRKPAQWGLLGLLAAALLAVAWWQLWPRPVKVGRAIVPSPHATHTPSPTPLPSLPPYGAVLSAAQRAAQLKQFSSPQTGETWLTVPVKLGDQHYFKSADGGEVIYYEVGKRSANTIVMSVQYGVGENIQLYERGANGKVTFISRPNAFAQYEDNTDWSQIYESAVTIDSKTHYDSLSIPQELDLSNGYVLTRSSNYVGNLASGPVIANANLQFTTLKTLGASSLMQAVSTNADTHLVSILYYIRTPFDTYVRLDFTPTETALGAYQWTVGQPVGDNSELSPVTRGCGALLSAATQDPRINEADVQLVATSGSGHQLYQLKDTTSSLFVKAYDEFKQSTDWMPDSDPVKHYSAADYQANHGLLLFKDNFGRWLVYVRSSLRFDGGCAKPVVYLYPTSPMPVSVRVGADVRVSDPAYDVVRGWDVWANPTGTVWVNGRPYPSLFWEGKGYGTYPVVTGGTVVARSEAPGVMRRQLAEQGLRGREIDDFMAYWEPKLPGKPYVRLTWFNTAQMDGLAPLVVSPRPDTAIRVFLDFEGLDAYEELPAQHLSAPERRGFTVVEWGGLANFRLE